MSNFPIRCFSSGDTVWEPGDCERSMMFILDGKINITCQKGYEILPLRTMGKGQVISAKRVLMDNSPKIHQVNALTDLKLIEISMEGFEIILKRKKKLAAQLAHNLACIISNQLEEAAHSLSDIKSQL